MREGSTMHENNIALQEKDIAVVNPGLGIAQPSPLLILLIAVTTDIGIETIEQSK